MTHLSVNVNKIATLRNTRALNIPNLVSLSRIALDAGAAGITIHPRPDGRHIRQGDVDDLAALLRQYPAAEFNIEGNPFQGLIEHGERVRPTQATLVPDTEGQSTSDHGWAIDEFSDEDRNKLAQSIKRLKDAGCRVSLFMDPRPDLMAAAKALGADRVELYTEPYASVFAKGSAEASLREYAATARSAADIGLGVNAGHDLSLQNLELFLHAVRPVNEVSIGHALIADALELGLAETVRRYVAICQPKVTP